MYSALGDVPLILQGAGQREKLSAEQAARVAAMGGTVNLPAAPVSAGFSPIVLYAGLGLAAAYLLATGRSRGGRLWR